MCSICLNLKCIYNISIMNTLKNEGIAEAKRWDKIVKAETYKKKLSKYVVRKQDVWVKVRERTEPDSKYFVRD